MKVLITGGGGFIGAWIVKRLTSAGIAVRVFDLRDDRRVVRLIAGDAAANRIEWQTGDISETAAVATAAEGCDTIIHLAGLLTPDCLADPVRGAKVNLIGALNVFLAARQHAMPRVIHMSSIGVFGPDDDGDPHPTTLYGAFKLAAEHSARAFWQDHHIASIGLRPFVVYGPGREHGISAGPTRACEAAARGEAYTIPFTGTFDMLYVDDVAVAFEQALHVPTEGAHVINLLGQTAVPDDVLSAIWAVVPEARIDAAGDPMPIRTPPPDGAAERLLPHWKPRSLQSGISETIAFYRDTAANR